MGRPRGPRRDTITLAIGDGDTITIRPDLTVRDADRLARLERRSEQVLGMAASLIVGWSLADQDGAPIPWPASIEARQETLYALDLPTYEAIVRAIDAHLTATAPKAAMPSVDASAPISPSVE